MRKMKDKYDVGVIVGRFQVAELTEAHRELINTVKDNHKQIIIVIGVSPTLGTKSNPLGFTARMRMIQHEFPNAIVSHIMDRPSDEDWSSELDHLIQALCPIGSVCLYGGRDSFVKFYHGIYDTFEMAIINQGQGTLIRDDIGKKVLDTTDFRMGIIHSCQNQYPKVFPTVDIAIMKDDGRIKSVLMGMRKDNGLYRFVGGFADPKDVNYEQTAQRETIEEVDVEVDGNFEYICSNNMEDWRYNSPTEKIITVLYTVNYTFGSGRPKEEFVATEWIPISYSSLPIIEGHHRKLFEKLLEHYKITKNERMVANEE